MDMGDDVSSTNEGEEDEVAFWMLGRKIGLFCREEEN